MKQTLITRIFNHILVILGFASTVSCGPDIVCMYGTPTMDFEVSGKAVNEDSAPVAGIKVSCYTDSRPDAPSVITAEDGSFNISGTAINAVLKFEDIDGPENGGEFEEKIEIINVEQVQRGDGNWYMGKYESKGVVIKMEKK